MKSKNHDKHKHKKTKKEKHENKSKKKMESTSESESESNEEVEWVESTHQEKSMRDDWMNNDGGSFEDLIPTYSKDKSGGERKRQRLRKSEAEKMLEKKLLEERELNPYLKKSGSGLGMMRPTDDNNVKSLNTTTVGDGGYKWLKKAYDRVKEQADEEGRTMEEVAVERWGSLERLEKMLSDAKQQSRGKERSRSRSPRRYDKYDKYRSNERSHRDASSSSSESKRNKYGDPYASKSHRDLYSKSSKERPYDESHKDSDSLHDAKRFLSPSDGRWPSWKKRKDDSHGDKSTSSNKYEARGSSSSSNHPAWKKKTYEKDLSFQKDTVLLDEGSSHTGQKVPNDKVISSSHSSSHQPAWKKKNDSESLQNRFAKEGEKRDHEKKLTPISTSESHLEEVEEKEDNKAQEDTEDSEDSDAEIAKKRESMKDVIMNLNEINFLTGRAIRAEIFGDFKLAEEIQAALALANSVRENLDESETNFEKEPRQEVMDYLVDSHPLPKRLQELYHRKRINKKQTVQVGPFKKQYLDDKLSLKEMFQSEKAMTIDDQLRMYVNTAAACKNSVNEDFADDDVSGKVAKKMDAYQRKDEKDIKKAIQDYKRQSSALDKCRFCLDKPLLLKHTIVAKGNHVIICVPPYTSLTEGHCFIIPISHVTSSLHLEENEFNELQIYKRGLTRMFSDENFDVIFMETSVHHRHFPHTFIECIPVPKDTADMAPMYFKKAIDECEMEWSQNKKLIDLAKKGFRHSVPKGLPFFSVEFSFGGGFAHIIEDEKNFPKHFGKEIIGGMLEIDSHLILKAKNESVEDLCEKTLKLINKWWNYKNFFES